MSPKYFPKNVKVTDQLIDTPSFSAEWKSKILGLSEKIFNEYKKTNQKRFVVVFAGPSGSGKSTNASVIESILGKKLGTRVISISLDGYHFSQDYLSRTLDQAGEPLVNHKGRFDSFDVTSLHNDINLFREGKGVAFPVYSRKIHNPIHGAIKCNDGEPVLMILEGLWLLYDEKPWNELSKLYDYKIFFNAPKDMLRQNTIDRHVRGGRPISESEQFYEKSDLQNTELIFSKVCIHDDDFSLDK